MMISLQIRLVMLYLTSIVPLLCLACSCVTSASRREMFCSHNFVAILYVRSQMTCFEWHSCYEVVVRRHLKAPSSPGVIIREVITANTTSACGQEFSAGSEYLVMGELVESGDGISTKAEVYSCSFPVQWTPLSASEKRKVLRDIKPGEACKQRKKRKRVLDHHR